ncbi:MAG: UDP-N-acetylglucosamine--N-acetylmuramyl-(pentapeptide) pyrophosphoryl-undecaprenol N-acetylglucosamine transferase [Candidatus Spechtbacteria bacterium]|nr:UDP-N-acetylglucosamine--N-acetylmuramyl-(pentapeptide) pyrophosphoryl-undecaprenol N-acetylglucosamine transferase [Candidatus Spechtbacteria bacterium]
MSNEKEKLHILLTGGGTGGHLFPLIAVARSFVFRTQEEGFAEPEVIFLGPGKMAQEIFAQEGITVWNLVAGKLRRYFSLTTILDILKPPITLIQSLAYLYWLMPDVIFAKGGYGSAFPVLVGWLYRIPIVIHESDSVMGLANRLLARFADKVILSFPVVYPEFVRGAKREHLPELYTVLGNPIRPNLMNGSTDEGRKIFQIDSQKPIILIQGGSQGAQKINELVLESLPKLLANFEVIHQIGEKHFVAVKEIALARTPLELYSSYHPHAFMDEAGLAHAYALCSLVVSRAGSGSIFEIAAIQKPSILIPLPSAADDHQKKNAYLYADFGASTVLEEQNLTPNLFFETINFVINDEQKRRFMSQRAAEFARPRAADEIAGMILDLINE